MGVLPETWCKDILFWSHHYAITKDYGIITLVLYGYGPFILSFPLIVMHEFKQITGPLVHWRYLPFKID